LGRFSVDSRRGSRVFAGLGDRLILQASSRLRLRNNNAVEGGVTYAQDPHVRTWACSDGLVGCRGACFDGDGERRGSDGTHHRTGSEKDDGRIHRESSGGLDTRRATGGDSSGRGVFQASRKESLAWWGAPFGRCVLVVVVLFVVAVVSMFHATTASAIKYNVPSEVWKVLEERLKVEPHLEHFGTDGETVDRQIDDALAQGEWLNEKYDGGKVGDIVKNYGLEIGGDGVEIDNLAAEMGAASDSAVADGATSYLVGGEAADAASSVFGITGLGAAALIPYAIAGAGAFSAGYLIGEIFYEQFFSGDDNGGEQPNTVEGVTIESEKWLKMHIPAPECVESWGSLNVCSGGTGPNSNFVEGKEVKLSPLSGSPPIPTYWKTHAAEGRFVYVLGVKAGGVWYDGSVAYQVGSIYVSRTHYNTEGGACNKWREASFEFLGWPPNVKNSQLVRTLQTSLEGCPHGQPAMEQFQVGIWRKPSQMPMNFPRKSSCPVGHTCTTVAKGKLPTTSTEFAKKGAELFTGPEGEHPQLEKFFEHYTVPGGETGKLPGAAVVPSCTMVEVIGSACVTLLEEAGFTNTKIEELGWEHAVVTKPPLTTIHTAPAEGTEVETGREITVVENPDTEHFPVAVPAIGYGHETATEYKARIESEGWSKVEVRTLTEVTTDPHIGPDQASYTSPGEGTYQDPSKATEIVVETNPSDAATPGEPSGGGSGPTVPAIKFPEIATPCTKFPFGIPCWLVARLGEFVTSVKTPKFEPTIDGVKMVIDFSRANALMEIVRAVELVLGTIGAVLLFGRFASSPTGSSDS
jgi:hypothetical protein